MKNRPEHWSDHEASWALQQFVNMYQGEVEKTSHTESITRTALRAYLGTIYIQLQRNSLRYITSTHTLDRIQEIEGVDVRIGQRKLVLTCTINIDNHGFITRTT